MRGCRASLLAVAGSRRAALLGVGGILPLPFCWGVVNDPSWLICGTDSLTRQWSSPPVYLAAGCTAWCPLAQTFAPFPFIPPTTGSSMSPPRGK